MKQIGITGGIGAGKTTVCRIFEALGAPIYYADDRAKWLMQHHQGLKTQLIEAFGEEVFEEGKLNRAFLARKAFADPNVTQQLNQLVHPVVGEDYRAWAILQQQKGHPYAIKEAALLVEAGSYRELDELIVVVAAEPTRINRVRKRDPFRTEEDVRNILERQMPQAEKQALAHEVIENEDGQPLLSKVLTIHERLLLRE